MQRILTCISISLLINLNIQAQHDWCGTPDRMSDGPVIKRSHNSKQIPDSIIIPVVIHLFYYIPGANISDAQIEDGLRVINEDFGKRNADTVNTSPVFQHLAADLGIEFRLARLDPNGDSTTGILRFDTVMVPDPEPGNSNFDNVKKVSAWPPDKYYNIWLVQSIAGGTLGYAQYPGTEFTYGGPWESWGIVVRSDQWGTIGTSSADGRTGTHEIGHTLGCYHTFLSQTAGCGSACDTTGDEVCDTPPADPSFDCVEKNTCSNDTMGPSAYMSDTIDQLENYMSYNSCQSMFSEGQKERMWMFIDMFDTIQNLYSIQNLIETGILPPSAYAGSIDKSLKLRVGPNPFKEEVSFRLEDNQGGILSITDLMGRIIYEQRLQKESTWIPSQVPAGIYTYRLETDKGEVISGKLVYLK